MRSPPALLDVCLLSFGGLVTQRHALELVEKPPPVVGQHLRVLDALLGPILVPAGHVVLRGLEGNELIADTLFDEDGAVVLVDDGFFVLMLRSYVSIK